MFPAASRHGRPRPSPGIPGSGLLRIATALCVAVAMSGCASAPSAPSSAARDRSPGREPIQEVHLFGIPSAINTDRDSGPAAFVVRVFASSHGRARGLPIKSGSLDILLYDGVAQAGTPPQTEPARVWSFPSDQLPPFASVSTLGVGYQFALPWEGIRLTQNRVTVLARYTSGSGSTCYSAPSIIPVGRR